MASAAELLGQDTDTDSLGISAPEPTPVPEPSAEPPVETGRPRDEAGRFAKKSEDAPSGAPVDAPKAEAPVDSAAPVEAAAEEVQPEPVDDAPVVDWSFRGSGQDISIEGAKYKAGHGVFIPEQSLDQTRLLLTHGMKYPQVRERAAKLDEQIKTGITRHQAENTALTEVFGQLLDPQKLAEFLQQVSADPALAAERLAVQLQKRHLEIERQFAGKMVEGTNGEPDEAAVAELADQMDEVFSDVMSRVWPDATPEQKKAVESAISENYRSFLAKAGADDPRGRWVRGQVIPAHRVLETFIRGERAQVSSRPTPQRTSSPPPKPAAAAPSKAPPSVGGPAKNIAGSQAGKPQTQPARKELADYWGMPNLNG